MNISNMAQFGQMGLNQFNNNNQLQYYPIINVQYPLYNQKTIPQGGFQQLLPLQLSIGYPQQSQTYQNPQYQQNQIQTPQDIKFHHRNISTPICQSQNALKYNLNQQKPSQQFMEQTNLSRKRKSQEEYSNLLDGQIQVQKYKQNQMKEQEQLVLQKLMEEKQRQQYYNKGAPQRDLDGNILTTKAKPGYRNYQNNLANQQYKIGSEQDIDSQQQTSASQNSYKLSSNIFNANSDIEKLIKREQAIELQRDIIYQIEEKRRQKKLQRLHETRELELEELRIQRERQEILEKLKSKIQTEQMPQKREPKWHQNVAAEETMRSLSPLLTYQQKNDIVEEKEEVDNDKICEEIKQKIMKNLPEEIETSIKDILKNELVLVRNEFSFQTLGLEEQIFKIRETLKQQQENRNQEEFLIDKDEFYTKQVVQQYKDRLVQAFFRQEKPHFNCLHEYWYDDAHQEQTNDGALGNSSRFVPLKQDFGKNYRSKTLPGGISNVYCGDFEDNKSEVLEDYCKILKNA